MKYENNYCWLELNLYKLTFIVLNIFLLCFENVPCKENYVYPKMHNITFINGMAYVEENSNLLCPDENIESLTHGINFINNNIYQLTITADFKMAYIWIYNEIGIDIFVTINDTTFTIDLPSGTLHLFTGFVPSIHQHSIIILDTVQLTSLKKIKLSIADASYITKYQFLKENGDSLRINTIGFYFFNHLLNTGLKLSHINFDTTSFKFHYNKISDYFEGEWAVKGKQLANDGNLYLLNNELKDFNKDTVITNNPINYSYADFNYHLPDSVESNNQLQLFTFIPDFHIRGSYDPYYTYPAYQRVYQDTSAALSLNSSTFWQGLYAVNILYSFINTSEIRIGQNNVKGYHYGDRSAPSFTISENKNVHIGLTPTYWFGKFFNENDTIKIRSPYGRWEYLFLSQSNDVLRHYPIDYQLYENAKLISSGEFKLWFGAPALRMGFHVNDLTMPVPNSKYKMVITDKQNEVAKYGGISRVTTGFDLNQSDKDPPNITLFQILSGNELANILIPSKENRIRFIIEDNESINSIQLFYTLVNDTVFYELPLNFNFPYHEADIPLLKDGYYSIRILVSDDSENYIDCLMKPAFLMGDATTISENSTRKSIDQFILGQNYPNPFNPSTTIEFALPKTNDVSLKIFNILGQEVATLVSDILTAGIYSYDWSRPAGMASGVYLYRLEAGDYVETKKMILMY